MKAKKKPISADTALKARALFAMAADHYRQASIFEAALADLLKIEDGPYCGHLTDAMVNGDTGFDKAMEKEGFAVKPPRKRRS